MGMMKDLVIRAQDEGYQAYFQGASPSDNHYSDYGLAQNWYFGYECAEQDEADMLDRMAEEEAAFRAYEDGLKAF